MLKGCDRSSPSTSTISLPPALRKPMRNSGRPPSFTSWRDTIERASGTTSTGSGKRPRRETYLLSSAMQIKRSAALATIFSRTWAPPPPLIICSRWLTSSAPSTYTASRITSLRWISGMPYSDISSELRGEVDTAPFTFLPLCPSASIKKSTVLPVPMPMYSLSGTNSTALMAASRLSWSCLLIMAPLRIIGGKGFSGCL